MLKSARELLESQIWLAAKKQWKTAVTVAASLLAMSAMTLVLPWPMKFIIDRIIVEVPSAGRISGDKTGLLHFIFASLQGIFHQGMGGAVYRAIGVYVVLALLSGLFIYVAQVELVRLGQNVTLTVRGRLFSHLINLPQSFFEKAKSGDLTNRISNDTAEIQAILEAFLVVFVQSLPTIAGILVVAFALDWIYALTFVVVIPVIYAATRYYARLTQKASRLQRRTEGALASAAQEAIYYHKAVAALSLEGEVTADLVSSGKLSALRGIETGRWRGRLTVSVELLVSLTTAFVLLVGVMRIYHGCLTVGQLTVFLAYLESLFKPVRQLSKFVGQVGKSLASNERIEEIMKIRPAEMGATDRPGAIDAPPLSGGIRFEGVRFGYAGGREVLRGFCLDVKAGETVAVVGESGSGKSTLVNLVLRLHDPVEGAVLLDGADARRYRLDSMRQQMATVLQDSYIFDTTVRENIQIAATSPDDSGYEAAARAAGAHDFIMELPEGYETRLGEGGSGLSGGQRRRLAIARAFMRNAPILLLDEPTTGLDAATEREVSESLRALARGRTTIIVSHQLSTIADADRIVVLSEGRVAESGRHGELLAANGLYAELWRRQTEKSPAG